MRLLSYIAVLTISTGCLDSNHNSLNETGEQASSKKTINEWGIDDSRIDLKRTDIYTESILKPNFYTTIEGERHETHPQIVEDSDVKPALIIEFNWTPKNLNTEKSLENKTYNSDYLHHRTIFMEILDTSKISKHVDYYIPNENIAVKGVFYGLFSNFELYKNLNGKVRFEELGDLNCKFKILMTAELNVMVSFKNDTILHEEIRVIKEIKKGANKK